MACWAYASGARFTSDLLLTKKLRRSKTDPLPIRLTPPAHRFIMNTDPNILWYSVTMAGVKIILGGLSESPDLAMAATII